MLDLSRHRKDTHSKDSVLDNEVLNMEPVLRPQPKLLNVDDKTLLNMARANFLSQITVSIPARGGERSFRSWSCAQKKVDSYGVKRSGAEPSWQQFE